MTPRAKNQVYALTRMITNRPQGVPEAPTLRGDLAEPHADKPSNPSTG